MLIPNLKLDYSYGIILCAIISPTNRQLPQITYNHETELPPFRVDRILVPLRLNAIKMISREGFVIFLIAAIIDLILLLSLMFCCRFWHLRSTMKERPIRNRPTV